MTSGGHENVLPLEKSWGPASILPKDLNTKLVTGVEKTRSLVGLITLLQIEKLSSDTLRVPLESFLQTTS